MTDLASKNRFGWFLTRVAWYSLHPPPAGGGELGSLFVRTIFGHRDVTKRESRNFEEFSKMAPLSFPNATFKVGFPGY